MATREIPEHHQWANNLKPGDVVFESGGFCSSLSKTKVSKVSKTHIYVGTNNTSYPRHTLAHQIDSWTTWKLYPSTPENESKWQLQQTRAKIQSLAHDIYDNKTKRSTVEVMTIEELLVLKGAMETVCGLLDEAAKRMTK